MKDKINSIRIHWANNHLAGNMLQGGNVIPDDTILVSSVCGEPLLTMRDLLILEQKLPEDAQLYSESNQIKAVEIETNKPDLGVDCLVWCAGKAIIDRLTDEDHYEAYWEESTYSYGDEDRFMVLPL